MEKQKTKLLRASDISRRLSISRSFAYQLIAAGHFAVVPVGGALRITEESLEDYIDRQKALFDAVEINS